MVDQDEREECKHKWLSALIHPTDLKRQYVHVIEGVARWKDKRVRLKSKKVR